MDFKEFKQRQENSRVAENFKFIVVIILILSVIGLTAIGEENARKIIFYWAGFMSGLVIIAAILDLIAWRKNKKIGAEK